MRQARSGQAAPTRLQPLRQRAVRSRRDSGSGFPKCPSGAPTPGQGPAGFTFLSVPFTRTVTLRRLRARSAVMLNDVTFPFRHVQPTS